MDVVIWTNGPESPDRNLLSRYIGAYKMAWYVRSHGYTAQVIDHIVNLTSNELYEYTKKFINKDTAILAISTTFLCQNLYKWPYIKGQRSIPYHVFFVLHRIKAEHPNIKIVLGGYRHNSASGWGLIDAAISGYAEDTFLELLEHLKLGKDEPIYSANLDRKWKVYSKPRNIRHNIMTDQHLFVDQDCILPNESLPLEISRGCIFHCKFCNHMLLGRKKFDYLRDFEFVKNEMVYNYEKWNVTNYFIICDTFNDTTQKMDSWYNTVKSLPFDINYATYLRADLLHRFPEVPIQLKEAGLIGAFHGIESFGEQASASVGKAWSGKFGRDWLPTLYHDIWEKKVYQTLGFIIGLPGDTKQDIIDTAHWFVKNDLYNINFTNLSLSANSDLPSEFEKDYKKYGYSFKDDPSIWYSDYWSKDQVINFNNKEVTPILQGNRSLLGSWDIPSALTYGYSYQSLSKENQLSYDRKVWWKEVAQKKNTYINRYKALLSAL